MEVEAEVTMGSDAPRPCCFGTRDIIGVGVHMDIGFRLCGRALHLSATLDEEWSK
jgi:hypothetical protein